MGNQPLRQICYALPIGNTDRKSNETFIHRNPDSANADPRDYIPDTKTIQDVLNKVFSKNIDSGFLGHRVKNPDGTLQPYFTWRDKNNG